MTPLGRTLVKTPLAVCLKLWPAVHPKLRSPFVQNYNHYSSKTASFVPPNYDHLSS